MSTGVPFTTHELTNLPVDQRGHQHLSLSTAATGTLDAHVTVIGDKPLTEGHVSIYNGAFSCNQCDAYPAFTYNGTRLVATTECPLPDGLDTIFTLTVTSGRVIVNDNLHPVYDAPLRHEIDVPGYNSLAGQSAYCHEMAELGCAYGPVGNTSPDLIQTSDNTYVIASHDNEAPTGHPDRIDGTVLANICTDLWAYSIADYQDWINKGGDPDNLPGLATVIDIPNGTYQFTHHTTRTNFTDNQWPVTYATVTRLP